mmetsp:Transcript_105248/g.181487  ORF Transcript_105248/g.181487 Transcript_105248/m.181487 type:complete len:85 (-) Transcript_105248:1390-1644(-)
MDSRWPAYSAFRSMCTQAASHGWASANPVLCRSPPTRLAARLPHPLQPVTPQGGGSLVFNCSNEHLKEKWFAGVQPSCQAALLT